ncbi:hypothetical protein K458DRAFT_434208, partial [Lentithecium fluviatile CBS 122367]
MDSTTNEDLASNHGRSLLFPNSPRGPSSQLGPLNMGPAASHTVFSSAHFSAKTKMVKANSAWLTAFVALSALSAPVFSAPMAEPADENELDKRTTYTVTRSTTQTDLSTTTTTFKKSSSASGTSSCTYCNGGTTIPSGTTTKTSTA